MTTAPIGKNKSARQYDWHEQDRFYEIMKNLQEFDIDLFIEIKHETDKESVDQVRLKKLQDLRTEVLELLKVRDFERFEEIKHADLRIYRELEELTQTK